VAGGERLDRRQRLFVGEPRLGRSSGLLEDLAAAYQPRLLAGRLGGEGIEPGECGVVSLAGELELDC